MVAHPELPALRSLPERVNPDRWVDEYHMETFKRHVSSNGSIKIDNHIYQVGKAYALQVATVYLNAIARTFQINVAGVQLPSQPIQGLHDRIMDFDEYAELMIEEARAIARQQH